MNLWGTGPDNIVAVGGRSNGMYAHWNGSEWRSEVLPGEPGLNGVWVNPEGIAWLVGERGQSYNSIRLSSKSQGKRAIIGHFFMGFLVPEWVSNCGRRYPW